MNVAKIAMRVFSPRGRIYPRFGQGRLRHKGMVRTSTAPQTTAASPRMIREHVRQTIGGWDPGGDQGRAELDDLVRRAGR